MGANEMSFGKYIESIRTARKKSLRETAKAIYLKTVAPYVPKDT